MELIEPTKNFLVYRCKGTTCLRLRHNFVVGQKKKRVAVCPLRLVSYPAVYLLVWQSSKG